MDSITRLADADFRHMYDTEIVPRRKIVEEEMESPEEGLEAALIIAWQFREYWKNGRPYDADEDFWITGE